jgi:hypothetical protein
VQQPQLRRGRRHEREADSGAEEADACTNQKDFGARCVACSSHHHSMWRLPHAGPRRVSRPSTTIVYIGSRIGIAWPQPLTPSSFAGVQRDPDVFVWARRRSFIAKLHSRPVISESSNSVPQTTSPVLSARAPLTESGEPEVPHAHADGAASSVFVKKG